MKRLLVSAIFIGMAYCGGEDKAAVDFSSPAGIKAYCGEDILCYHDKVIKSGREEWCETIKDYWEGHDQSMVGSCYYKIALKNKDSSLCERIKKENIRKKCEKDLGD